VFAVIVYFNSNTFFIFCIFFFSFDFVLAYLCFILVFFFGPDHRFFFCVFHRAVLPLWWESKNFGGQVRGQGPSDPYK